MPRVNTELTGTRHQKSTWLLLPSEASKRPSTVIVTSASGSLLARIDPITRERRDPTGHLLATLSQQGWALDTKPAPYVSTPAHSRPLLPVYSSHLRDDRDSRA